MALLSLLFPYWADARCLKVSCDPSISYAMGQELAVITRRMGHLNNAISSMSRDTELQSKIMLKENIEWMRMRARMRIRIFNLMKENYNTSKSARLEGMNVDLVALRAGAEKLIRDVSKRMEK